MRQNYNNYMVNSIGTIVVAILGFIFDIFSVKMESLGWSETTGADDAETALGHLAGMWETGNMRHRPGCVMPRTVQEIYWPFAKINMFPRNSQWPRPHPPTPLPPTARWCYKIAILCCCGANIFRVKMSFRCKPQVLGCPCFCIV